MMAIPFSRPAGLAFLAAVSLSLSLRVDAQEGALSAAELAAKLGAVVEDGDSLTRLRMTIKPKSGGEKTVIQVQIKARRVRGKTDVLYQVLWPKERKGESFLLSRKGSGALQGFHFSPPDKMTKLGAGNMTDPVLGGDLAYQDVVENFFRWKDQSISGKETIQRRECVILESKPGANDSTPYGRVKSWIDPKRLVAMRVEKFDQSGKLARRIDTNRVAKADNGVVIPAGLMVRKSGGGSQTEIDGSNIRHDVKLTGRDFTTSAMTDFKVSR